MAIQIIPLFLNQELSPPFQTTVVLDGISLTLQVRWNVMGQRYYFSLTDQSSNVIFYGPLIASPDNKDIPLALGVIKNSLFVFRETTQNFEVTS